MEKKKKQMDKMKSLKICEGTDLCINNRTVKDVSKLMKITCNSPYGQNSKQERTASRGSYTA